MHRLVPSGKHYIRQMINMMFLQRAMLELRRAEIRNAFAGLNMHRKMYHRFLYIMVILLIVDIYYRMDRATNVFHYIPRTSKCQSLPTRDSNNTNRTSCVTGRPCTYSDVVDLRIIVITFNRSDSLSVLLRSLDTLVVDGDRAALEIWIDRDRKNFIDQRTLEVASAFKWKGGSTRVHVQVAVYYLFLPRDARSASAVLLS